jgi:hypothetical protein
VAVAFPPDVEVARRVLPEVRAVLGEAAFGRAWDAGRLMRPGDVPALAREIGPAGQRVPRTRVT